MRGNRFLVSIVMASVVTLSGVSVHAITTGGYSGSVPILNDLESKRISKETSKSTALNTVKYIEKGKLVSWVERDGTNMTVQVGYTSIGNKNMAFYANGITSRSKMNLNISTSPTTLSSVGTNGTWTPN